MSAEAAHSDDGPATDREMRSALISAGYLGSESLQKVDEHARTSNLSLADAVIALGIATAKEIEDALVWHRRTEKERVPSFIEAAIRKESSRRQLVVREGAEVRAGKKLLFAHDPYNPRSETMRALRTELLLRCQADSKGIVIAVLSPSSGEGRSLLAAELAIAFAQLGRRTLLVDADMRNPKQHTLFDSDNFEGLSQAIATGDHPFTHRVTGLPQMSLLTAGPIPPNPLELLSDGRFEKLERKWRDTYDFIIIDTPPVAQCADGLAVATIAGRVLLVNRAQHTSYKEAREMLRRLETTQALVLGAVISHF